MELRDLFELVTTQNVADSLITATRPAPHLPGERRRLLGWRGHSNPHNALRRGIPSPCAGRSHCKKDAYSSLHVLTVS
jgi:hypothetical protein